MLKLGYTFSVRLLKTFETYIGLLYCGRKAGREDGNARVDMKLLAESDWTTVCRAKTV